MITSNFNILQVVLLYNSVLHFTSNITSIMFFSAFGAEILVTGGITSKCQTFCKTSMNFISKYSNRVVILLFSKDLNCFMD